LNFKRIYEKFKEEKHFVEKVVKHHQVAKLFLIGMSGSLSLARISATKLILEKLKLFLKNVAARNLNFKFFSLIQKTSER
jgi:hypothetical protein